MRQRRWVEFLANYNYEISYCTGITNAVADALSRKEPRVLYHLKCMTLVMIPGIFEQLQTAQTEGLEENHVKEEVMVKQHARLVEDN